jgi:hypothetical protein
LKMFILAERYVGCVWDQLVKVLIFYGVCDAVHIGRGNWVFWRERGGEEQRYPSCERIASRLTTWGIVGVGTPSYGT